MPLTKPATKPRWRRTLGALFSGLFSAGVLLWLALTGLLLTDEHVIGVEPGIGMLILAAILFLGLVYTIRQVRKAW